MGKVRRYIESRLLGYGYLSDVISIARKIILDLVGPSGAPNGSKYQQAEALIDLGNKIREVTGDNAILAIGAINAICKLRGPDPIKKPRGKRAYIISSLKHPDEVAELRRTYGSGFYLIAVHADKERRLRNLREEGEGMTSLEAKRLSDRDEHESQETGQHMRDTFHLADFFVADENNEDKLRASIHRCLDLIFGHPTLTPTFNEFAMFMAVASSMRSADLSRQVGAVVAKRNEILSTGANDCPRFGGGLYWPIFKNNRVVDIPNGRDYIRGYDSNSVEKKVIIESVIKACGVKGKEANRVRLALKKSAIGDITEYGRVVHAEMEAILACARKTISCRGGTIYCTTFPCHNCAKHIIAAGIKDVVYIEPYPKSKALTFHDDSATTERGIPDRVRFKPFVGVGPRRFLDFFAMRLGSGKEIKRKNSDGTTIRWKSKGSLPRVAMLPYSYLDIELYAQDYWNAKTNQLQGAN